MSSKQPKVPLDREQLIHAELKPIHSFVAGRNMGFVFNKMEVSAELLHYLVAQADIRSVNIRANIEVQVMHARDQGDRKIYQQYLVADNNNIEIEDAFVVIRYINGYVDVQSRLVPTSAKLDFPADNAWFGDYKNITVVVLDEVGKKPSDKLEYQLKFVKAVKDEKQGINCWEDIHGNKTFQGCF